MKLVFSRKGFDSSSGGCPSPIIDGVPRFIPIPTESRSDTRYEDLRLGELVEELTNGRVNSRTLCHLDPMFQDGYCAFGQVGAAQSHLSNMEVGVGSTFLFWGLYTELGTRLWHHRIFGYLVVEAVIEIGSKANFENLPWDFQFRHPHTIGEWGSNNTVYLGHGNLARNSPPTLRLTANGCTPSVWRMPEWLRGSGLSYHRDPNRWLDSNRLQTVARGQEFVTDIDGIPVAQEWLHETIETIEQGN